VADRRLGKERFLGVVRELTGELATSGY